MKALILAAGRGTRLRPLTYTRAKPLLRVANQPIMAYALRNLVEAGILDIGIVVSESNQNEIAREVMGLVEANITLICQSEQLGLAHGIRCARDFLADEDFCVYLGDNLFEGGIGRYIDAFRDEACDATLALVRVPDPRQFGVAVMDAQGRLERLVEKPDVPPSDLAIAGVYCFSSAVHPFIDALEPSARGEYELTDALQAMISSGKAVRGVEVVGWWKDTGRPEDLLEANRLLLERIEVHQRGTVHNSQVLGRVQICEGAIIRNSTIVGPAIIGAGAQLEGVYVGPHTSIGAGAVLTDVELEYSVIGEEAVLESVPARMRECLVGRKTVVRGNKTAPIVYRMVVSDMSTLEL